MTLKKHNAPWTKQDVRRLRQLARMKLRSQGRTLSAKEAAALMGRTPGAIKYKAMVEGVRFRAIEQPRGTQRTPRQRRTLARLARARHRAAA